jgi:hypothetical protein
MSNIFDASTAIMAPYTGPLTVTVSCISIDANKNATVKWSETRNGTKLSGAVSIPSDLKLANSQIVYSTVSYSYKPAIGYTITGTLTLSEQMYMMPRITAPSYPDTSHTCT